MSYRACTISLLIFQIVCVSVLKAQDKNVLDSLQKIVNTSHDYKVKVNTLLKMADVTTADLKTAISIIDKAVEIARESDDPGLEASCLNRKALRYYLNSDFRNVIETSKLSIEVADRGKALKEKAQALYGIGRSYYDIGDKKKCSEFYFSSLKISEEINDTASVCKTLSSIGILFMEQSDFTKALYYFQKALPLSKEMHDLEGISAIINNIASVYLREGKNEEALKKYFEALRISESIHSHNVIGHNYLNIGKAYSNLNDYEKSMLYFQKSLKRFETHGDNNKSAIVKLFIGDLELKHHNLVSALQYATEAYKVGKDDTLMEILYKSAALLNKIYLARKDTVEAYKYVVIANQWKDSLAINEKEKNLASLEMQYQFDKKEQEELAASQRRTFMVILGFSILTLGIIIILLILNQLRLKAKKVRLEKQGLEQELDFKKKELTLNVLSLMKQNELLSDISRKILHIEEGAVNPETKDALKRVGKEVQKSTEHENLKEFSLRFKEIHKDFYDELLRRFPELTPSELRLCAFLRLNMTSKEISELTGQQLNTLENARYRLRQKLGISNSDVNLVTFLAQI